jgi:tetratricopeptide (TPR) repeat protein
LGLALLAGFCSFFLIRGLSGTNATDPSTTDQWEKAQDFLARGELEQARDCLNRCLETWPANAEVRFLLGRTYRRLENVAGWRTHLHAAQALRWGSEEIELERRLMRMQSGAVRGVEDALAADLKAGTAEEPLILEAMVKGYLSIFSLNDVTYWTGYWMERYPNDWQPWFYRARGREAGRHNKPAREDYYAALERKHDLKEAHLGLGRVLMIDGQFKEALAEFQTYLREKAEDATALLGAANCQYYLGDLNSARTTLDKLFAVRSEDAAGFLVKARVELAWDKPAEALIWLKKAEALAPYETDVLYVMALTLRKLEKQDEAEQYERKYKEIQQQYERLDALTKQIVKQPDNVSVRYEACMLLLQLGRDEQAEGWFRSLLRIDPKHQPTHAALADLFEKRGDPQRAEYHRQRAKSTPETPKTLAP